MSQIKPDNISNVIVTGKSGAGKQPRIDVLVDEFDLEQLSTGDIFRYYIGVFADFGYKGDLDLFWDEDNERFISDEKIFDELDTKNKDVILGLKAKYFVDRGFFVPDYITNKLFESYFAKKDFQGQVIDGYPRTLNQSRFLMELLEKEDSKIDFIVLVKNSDKRIIERTTKRRICPKCGKVYHLKYKPPDDGKFCKKCGSQVIQRSDDTEEKLRSRLNEFKEKTKPAIDYLEDKSIPLVEVSGHLEDFNPENVHKSVMDEIKKLY
ncbi:MAG: nucleoside monophosphate kinase [Candidatus Thermoplasmatota archaeon]